MMIVLQSGENANQNKTRKNETIAINYSKIAKVKNRMKYDYNNYDEPL